MGSMPALVWKEVVGKRWVRCGVWQAVISSVVWILWESIFPTGSYLPFESTSGTSQDFLGHSVWSAVRFLVFQASQLVFLVGQIFISEPEERDAASPGDLASGVLKVAWKEVVGRSCDDTPSNHELRHKIQTTVDYAAFCLLCTIAGFLGVFALTSSIQLSTGRLSSLEVGVRGASFGLAYAGLQVYHKSVILAFPIIQRRFFFAFKMGISKSVSTSFKVALAVLPVGETFVQIFPSESNPAVTQLNDGYVLSFLVKQCLFAAGTFFLTFCWELCHHLVQVIQTRRHVFAPPLGSAAAESDPTELLLLVLEEPETAQLVQYHAFLDLSIVAETNVETWRRAAFFEETGETYKRLIAVCLWRLDNLTTRLAQGLEVFENEKSGDFFRQQMQSPQGENRPPVFETGSLKRYFRDFQIGSWCARTVSSLTASSRYEDRYGVAQLHGCNPAVVSSLLSCLLVVEVYLGRRNSARGVSFVPNSIKWTVPSRGAFMEVGKRHGYPFGKRTVMHKKAYTMADVLRTSLYHIVSVFGEEMVQVGAGGKGYSIVERDWLSRTKPLYGSHEMHVQKLSMFLDYRVG